MDMEPVVKSDLLSKSAELEVRKRASSSKHTKMEMEYASKSEYSARLSEADVKKRSHSTKHTNTAVLEPPSHDSVKVNRKYSSEYPRSPSRSHTKRRRIYVGDRMEYSLSYRPSHSSVRAQPHDPVPNKVLGIFGLGSESCESSIRRAFEKFGEVLDVHLVEDTRTGILRGFGFIYFKRTCDAKYAVENGSNIRINGRKVRVDYSLTNRPHKSTPGIYMGRKQRLTKSRHYHENEYSFKRRYSYDERSERDHRRRY
ncbi:transformer-2 protein homolog alpha-like isoform X2 [Teleopsis dalmanni]|uniref:transformer-2 protein homolog alpha-like isoform X2 n=1 Tax=Teleopsis dalmanni TaxID=139649 RepID=UPI0018CE47B6|nr:transformer-2 protein homolog alpha-like isoform X2 [Teleopsis dalmanni]